ncbi:MAG: MurT ligase domain-containing protein [Syntrophomonadaceae bacterium]|jgi:UDP-N-acetylmuramyl tripeptide synthase
MLRVAAVLVGKLMILLSRLLGNQGTDFPGLLARKIYPGILKELAKNITEEIFVVTGTNGKTTTANMLAGILSEKGYRFVHNRAGANMISGITTAFIDATNLLGTRKHEYALLETDEANVPLLLKEIKINALLITNFFRDQLDRYGELDHTINLIKDSVRHTAIELVLNADDPLVVHFHNETGLHCWYYGFDDTAYDTDFSLENREGRYCIYCGHEISYRRFHYAQLGKFNCPQCGSSNPKRNFTGSNLVMNPAIKFRVNDISIVSQYQGFFNAYNILAACSLAKLIGIEDDVIQRAIYKYKPRAGRMETFIINGKPNILVLVKNPAGLNQTIATLLTDNRRKNLFFALNDNAADGRDISWIWDSNLELASLPETNVSKIVCSGLRSGDIAVRFKYSGFNPGSIIIIPDLKEGVIMAINQASEVNYILCTYTALFALRKILEKLQKQEKQPVHEERRAYSTGLGE